jgi:N-acetylneuraminate synthase
VIAEAGVNHNGDVALAKELINCAVEAGADAVKFQTFKTENLVSASAPKANYQMATTDATESQFEMLKKLELSHEAHHELKAYCRARNILFMSTPFDKASADFLEQLGLAVFKIGSGEVTNWPLLAHIAAKNKPVILSTGMSYLSEVDEAVRVLRQTGNQQVVVLHCVTNYPTDPTSVNLRAMHTLAQALQVPVGYSDHTPGIAVPLAAVAMGACVIEKHFTLDKTLPGPDHRASLDPQALKKMVEGIRIVEQSLGHGLKIPARSESRNRKIVRRSLGANRDIPSGTVLTQQDLVSLRPASGISPTLIKNIVGRKVKRSLKRGQLITWEDLA